MKSAPNKRKSLNILIPFLIIALVFGALVWKKHLASVPSPEHNIKNAVGSQKVVLFFVADGSSLGRESRDIEPCADKTECLRDVLEELFSGPVSDLNDAMPEGAMINSVQVYGDMAVIDVNSNFASEMPSGSSAEMMAVYSIVNTVSANFPQINSVKLNVEGDRNKVLRHIDLSDPFKADYTLEKTHSAKSEEKAVQKQ